MNVYGRYRKKIWGFRTILEKELCENLWHPWKKRRKPRWYCAHYCEKKNSASTSTSMTSIEAIELDTWEHRINQAPLSKLIINGHNRRIQRHRTRQHVRAPPRLIQTDKKPHHRAIIMTIGKFATYRARQLVLKVRRKLKQSGISIAEDLTAANYKILTTARKSKNVTAAWSQDGRIYVSITGKSDKKHVNSLKEAKQLWIDNEGRCHAEFYTGWLHICFILSILSFNHLTICSVR